MAVEGVPKGQLLVASEQHAVLQFWLFALESIALQDIWQVCEGKQLALSQLAISQGNK